MHKRRIKRILEITPDFRDIDLMGFVHNTVYFLWFERGRLQILDDVIPLEEAVRMNVAVVVVENRCEYLNPVTRGDRLVLITTHEVSDEYGGALSFTHDLINSKTKVRHAHAVCKCSIVDPQTRRLIRNPDPDMLEKYRNLK